MYAISRASKHVGPVLPGLGGLVGQKEMTGIEVGRRVETDDIGTDQRRARKEEERHQTEAECHHQTRATPGAGQWKPKKMSVPGFLLDSKRCFSQAERQKRRGAVPG